MIQPDTVKLLRECDAGIRMGTDSIDQVLPHTNSRQLQQVLRSCRDAHRSLGHQVTGLLNRYQDEGKKPNPIASGMSKMKTGWKLTMDRCDATVADLITDGCNMGVKSLSRYLNQYRAADEESKDIAKKLIHLEAQLSADIRQYL